MKEQLTIEHLAPYSNTELKLLHCKKEDIVWSDNGKDIIHAFDGFKGKRVFSKSDKGVSLDYDLEYILPILRPLSDLTKEIEHNGEKFVPMARLLLMRSIKYHAFGAVKKHSFYVAFKNEMLTKRTPIDFIRKLWEWHFDTEGLIEKGLAIDKKTWTHI